MLIRFHPYFFQRAITQERGIIMMGKICISYFFMRNPYIKFENPSMHGSEVMLCIKTRNGRTDAQTSQKQYVPPTSSKLEA